VESAAHAKIGAEIFGISGYNPITPFDPNVRLPTTATGTSKAISATISTSSAEAMLLGLSYGGNGMIGSGAGFNGICLNTSPCAFTGLGSDASVYKVVTTTQSGETVFMTQTDGASWGLIADAIQSASPSVTSVSPNKGSVGTIVSIKGASLTDVTILNFCGTSQPSFRVVNDTLITTTAPQLIAPPSTQTCDVTVVSTVGTSAGMFTNQFSFLPIVTSVGPATGGAGTLVRITGSGFIGTVVVALCGTSQPKFTIINDTQISLTISNLGIATSKSCDVEISNPVGKSSISSNDVFTYVQGGSSGGTNRSPNIPTNSNKLLYITLAGIAAGMLVAVAGLMRRWDPRRKEPRHFQTEKEPATHSS
jgi:hypothetical protein